MRDPQENDLLERLKARDESAMAELAAAYSSKIYQLAFRYLRNKEDAEEVTQDVLFKVYRKVDAFRGDAALSSWIYRITFNAAMSRLRTARYQRTQEEERQVAAPLDGEPMRQAPRDVADWSDLADERVLRSQLRRRVMRAILALPAIYRAPVMLRDIQGMSTEEASAMLKVKDQTLKSRLHRGRLILRKQLADFAGGLAMHRPIYGT
jgi:RNA polymerase sigma-70 factor (ECF subfamily)